jgi:exosome complex RNA-binding protein Rrp42 (RNase PH superfamily)
MKGMPEFQAVMARLLERCILPGHSVDPSNLCISSGKRQLPATLPPLPAC